MAGTPFPNLAFQRRVALFALLNPMKEALMRWKTPRIAEIAVGMEINSYACAVIK
jgi:coenzyme PQQ precursor peptide PqqA